MIESYKGGVYDPASGSGGMFVMSEKFIEEHQGNIQDITILRVRIKLNHMEAFYNEPYHSWN